MSDPRNTKSAIRAAGCAGLLLLLATPPMAHAEDVPSPAPADAASWFPLPLSGANAAGDQAWAIHGQSTLTWQLQPAYHAAYSGAQSLPRDANGRETFDATLFLGYSPWKGAEIWFNPEIDQGFGLGNSFGVAGYLSGEAYKLGQQNPYYRLARLFVRQTVDLGGETVKLDPDANQLGMSVSANRLVFTVGKYAVTDIFDDNKYAHDPRGDFLNWSILDAGTFDYAADAWGASYGATAEWYQGRWTARVGVFDLSNHPNSTLLGSPVFQQDQVMGELEERHTLWEQPGKLKFLYWLSRGNFGTYNDALALATATGQTPSTGNVRHLRNKVGALINVEQQIQPDLGFFLRAGVTQGGVEEDDFTDVDQSLSGGFALSGNRWNRPDDTVGIAAVVNQISHAAKAYLAAGGLGGIVGDGALKAAGPEQILETYYSYAAFSWANVTLDYQFVNNPAYNRQRGPVSVFALRTHVEF